MTVSLSGARLDDGKNRTQRPVLVAVLVVMIVRLMCMMVVIVMRLTFVLVPVLMLAGAHVHGEARMFLYP